LCQHSQNFVVKPVCSSCEILGKIAKPLCCNRIDIFRSVPSIVYYI